MTIYAPGTTSVPSFQPGYGGKPQAGAAYGAAPVGRPTNPSFAPQQQPAAPQRAYDPSVDPWRPTAPRPTAPQAAAPQQQPASSSPWGAVRAAQTAGGGSNAARGAMNFFGGYDDDFRAPAVAPTQQAQQAAMDAQRGRTQPQWPQPTQQQPAPLALWADTFRPPSGMGGGSTPYPANAQLAGDAQQWAMQQQWGTQQQPQPIPATGGGYPTQATRDRWAALSPDQQAQFQNNPSVYAQFIANMQMTPGPSYTPAPPPPTPYNAGWGNPANVANVYGQFSTQRAYDPSVDPYRAPAAPDPRFARRQRQRQQPQQPVVDYFNPFPRP